MAISKPVDFGTMLRRYRLGAGLTQEELAERASLSVRGISNLERGVRRAPYPDTLNRLAGALELTPAERRLFFAIGRGRSDPSPLPSPGYFSRGALIGRTREQDRIRRHLERTERPVLLARGEPGIGKTRLLRWATEHAASRGLTTISGGAQRGFGQEDPYSPLASMLETYLGRLEAPQLRRAVAGCSWLVRLLPELPEMAEMPVPLIEVSPEQEQRLIRQAVRKLLANVAGPTGAVLVVDDLQWAGATALQILSALAEGDGTLVLGAYRDTEVGPSNPLAAAMANFAERELADEIRLQTLDPDDARQLLTSLLETDGQADNRDAIAGIVERAGGLPFFLVSCAHALQGGQQTVPWSVAQSVRQRAAALSETALRILRGGSLVGRIVPRFLVPVLADAPETAAMTALDEACAAGLLLADDDRTYRFAHDLIREVLEDDLKPGETVLVHLRIGEALAALPDPHRERHAAEIAWHFGRGDDPARALPWALQAGKEAAARFLHAEAEQQYRRARELARTLGAARPEAEALENLGEVLRRTTRYVEAIAALEEAGNLFRQLGDVEGEARVTGDIGIAYFERGATREGLQRIEPALASLMAAVSPAAQFPLYFAWTLLLGSAGRLDDLLEASARWLEAARAAANTRMIADAGRAYGAALVQLGRVREGSGRLEEAAEMAAISGDPDARLHALTQVALVHLAQGDPARAIQEQREAQRLAEMLQSPGLFSSTLCELAQSLLLVGEWEEAAACITRALDLTSEGSGYSLYPILVHGRLALLRGDRKAAEAILQRAERLAQRMDDRLAAAGAQGYLALLDVLEGRPERALGRLEPLLQFPDPTLPQANELLQTATRAYLNIAGGERRARTTLDRLLRRAEEHGDRVSLLWALSMHGELLLREGRTAHAQVAFERALALARAMPYPYAEAHVLAAYGASTAPATARDQEAVTAEEMRERAATIFRQLGARNPPVSEERG